MEDIMRKSIIPIWFVICASAANAQSPNAQADAELEKCVDTAATRYASLPDSLSDVGTAAFASCSDQFDAMSDALDKTPQGAVKAAMLRDARQKLIDRAMAKAADTRLQPK